MSEPVYITPGDANMTPAQIRELQDALNAFADRQHIVLPPKSKVEEVELAVQQVQSGIVSIDEVRERLDLPPWGLQETSEPVVFTRQGPIPFSMAPQMLKDLHVTRVLLTGAGGFAGSHCLEHLLVNTDWEIVCTDSFRHRGKTDRIREILDARPEHAHRVTVITHDLTAPFSVQAAINMRRIDYIFAYASESHVNRSITDPVPFIMNNVSVALNTLELARLKKPTGVVMVSTDEVYGPIQGDAASFKEWDTILPSNPYSGSKAAQEAIAFSYWRTYNVPVVIVNSMNIIGERQDPEKFVPLVINAVNDGREVTIHGSEGNVGTRHYMHARNLADAILYIIRHGVIDLYNNGQHGIDRLTRYNIAPDTRVDNLTFAQVIAAFMGKELKFKFEDFPDQRPGHDRHYGLDNSKLTSLGWKQPVDLYSSLKKTVDWYLANPIWLKG